MRKEAKQYILAHIQLYAELANALLLADEKI